MPSNMRNMGVCVCVCVCVQAVSVCGCGCGWVCVCGPCAAKRVLYVPVLHGWKGSCGKQIQTNVQGATQQMLVQEAPSELLFELL